MPGDSFNLSLSFSYNSEYLPFSYRALNIEILHQSDTSLAESFKAIIYFTPYNSLEVWDYDDFLDLKRSWESPEYGLLTEYRDSINPDSIPISNLSDDDFKNDSFQYQYFSLPGLAYVVPMKNIEDIDSNTIMNGAVKFKRDDCGPNKQRYKGTISGDVKAWLNTNRNNIFSNVSISGIAVSVYDRDYGWNVDDFLGSGYTDDNGNFSINIDVCQNFQGVNQPEGDDLELYIEVLSHHHNPDIKVRNRIGATIRGTAGRSNPFIWTYNNGDNNHQTIGTFYPGKENTKLHLLHYAYQTMKYCNESISDLNLGSSGKELVIMRTPFNRGGGLWHTSGAFMLPGPVSSLIIAGGVSVPTFFGSKLKLPIGIALGMLFSAKDCIYRDFEDDEDENIAYHEFGHYLMWHLQNKCFNYQIPFNDHSLTFNSGQEKLAWTEGWAEGFAQIMDIVYRNQDNEAGQDASFYHYENRTIDNDEPENYEQLVRRGNINNRTQAIENTVTHGLASEMNTASMLVDLFDGPNNPNIINGSTKYNDYTIWRSSRVDDASLTLQQICQPLIDNRPSDQISFPYISQNVIQNVYEYGNELIRSVSCELKPEIKEVFNENFISDFESTQGELINSDDISQTMDVTFPTFVFKTKEDLLFFDKNVTCENLKVDITHLPANSVFNYRFEQSAFTMSDELIVNGGELLVNNNWSNSFAQSNVLNVCNRKLTIVDDGLFQVGDAVSSGIAHAIIELGSELFLKNDNSPGILRIQDNSRLTIEEGATLRIGPNTQIILDGPNAMLEIKGTLKLESGACFCPTGGSNGQGFVRFNMPGISNAVEARSRIYLGQDASIQFSGTSASHKLVEITDHVLWLDDDADNSKFFSIKNGMIEMGENAVLNLGIRSELDHTTIAPMSGVDDFHGVYLWGHRNTINHVNIENSRNGLKSYNVVGGFPLLAKNLTLDGCENGLWIEGKGLVYNTGEIKNGNSAFGIQANGMDIPSFLQSIQVNNVDEGVSFTGNKTAALSVTGSTFQVTVNGLDYLAPGSLYSRCSNYYGSNTGTGMRVAAGTLEMSNAFGRSGGGNRFYNTTSQDAFNKSVVLLAAPLYLHNGINDLKFNSGTGNFALFGRTRDVTLSWSGSTINAAQNFWALPSNDAPQHGVNTLLFQDNAYLMYIISIASPTNHYSLQTTFDNARNTHCSNQGSQGGSAGIGYAMYANPRSITWQNPNQNVKDVFEEILTDQYDTLNTDNLIPDWETALTAPEWNSGMVPVDWYYIDIGINKMNELAALYLSQDSAFLEEPDSTHNHLVSLKNVLNHWAQRSDTSSDSAAMLLSQHIQFAKAGFYTLVNDYSKALTIYTSLASNADSSLFPLAEYWICQLYRMNQIKDTGTHYMFVDSLEPCTAVYPENYPEPFRDDVKTLDVPKPELVMYPNPAGNTLNVLFETAQSATIQIIDPIGKVVLEKSTKTHSQPWEIDISSLPAGMYVVKCIMEDRQKVITLPLVKMSN